MAEQPLLTHQIEAGRVLLSALRREGFPVHTAMWVDVDETLGWRLVLATDRYADGLKAHEDIARIKARYRHAIREDVPIRLVRPSEPMIRVVREDYSDHVEYDTRVFTGQRDQVYLSDAYLYADAA